MEQPEENTWEGSDSKIRRLAFFALIFSLVTGWISALDANFSLKQYIHTIWTSDNGLPANSIHAAVQSGDGYIWFGSQQGLIRFNGYDFEIFDEFNTEEIFFSYISCLFTARDGGLWFGTRGGGLNFFDGIGFQVFTQESGLSSNFITAIQEDEFGRLWIGTENHGLNLHSEGRFIQIQPNQGPPIKQVNQIFMDSSNTLWIASGTGLYRTQPGSDQVYSVFEEFHQIGILSVVRDRFNRLWIGTAGEGLYRFESGSLEKIELPGNPSPVEFSCIREDSDGNIWIGTRRGLLRFMEEKFEIFAVRDGLSGDEVLTIFEDREMNLWVGTSNGINQFKDRNVTIIDRASGLGNDMVWNVFEDRNGFLWIGTNGGGLVKRESDGLVVITQEQGLPSNVIRSIYQDPAGMMWIGTRRGLALMTEQGKVERIFTQEDGLDGDMVRAACFDSRGFFWAATSNGLYRMIDGRFKKIHLSDDLNQIMVFCIREDSAGCLWIGSQQGLFRIGPKGVEHFQPGDHFHGPMVFDILPDDTGEIWLASHIGLVRFAAGRFFIYQRQDGLPDNIIYALILDQERKLWLSSNHGIFALPLDALIDYSREKSEALKPIYFNQADGMHNAECNGGGQPSICLTKRGFVWLPTITGAVGIDTRMKTKSESPLSVEIESVKVDDRAINTNKEIILPSGTRKIEFQFAALTYISPGKTEYRVILDNYDRDWYDLGYRNSVYFTNLPPGRYNFRVMARRAGGDWGEGLASIAFLQRPYFYQTIWFYLGCLLFLTVGIISLIGLRTRGLKRREKNLTKLVKDRTMQLQIVNRELERLSIQDELTGIYNHRRFGQFYEYEWKRAVRHQTPLSLIMIDIDFFKKYNDTYGHMAGDHCLRKIAQTLQKTCQRSGDMVARYGGEEFIIVLSDTPQGGTGVVAERIRQTILDLKIPHQSSSISEFVTASIGWISLIPDESRVSSLMLKAADSALYQSKRDGRNRVTQSNPDDPLWEEPGGVIKTVDII